MAAILSRPQCVKKKPQIVLMCSECGQCEYLSMFSLHIDSDILQMTVSNSYSAANHYVLWFDLNWSLYLICNPDLSHLMASLSHNVLILTRVFQANYANISAANSLSDFKLSFLTLTLTLTHQQPSYWWVCWMGMCFVHLAVDIKKLGNVLISWNTMKCKYLYLFPQRFVQD